MPSSEPTPDSGNLNIDVLTTSLRWAGGSVTFGVPLTAEQYGDNAYSYERDGVTYFADETDGFVAPAQSFIDAVRDAAAMIESYTLLDMVELVANPGDAIIRAGVTNTPKPTATPGAAYAVGPKEDSDPLFHTAGDAWFPISGLEQLGRGDYHTVLHEMAHTVGLLDVNRPQEDGTMIAAMDPEFRSLEFTTQSYVSYIGDTVKGWNYSTNSAPQTYMMWDIQALQHIYGANYTTQSGNTTYGFDPNTGQMTINGAGQGVPSANVIFRTVWDGGGTDTYDFSTYGADRDLDIDLRPGKWSDVDRDSDFQAANLGGGPYGVAGGFARGQVFNAMLFDGDARSLIENANGGAGDDNIRGNQVANLLVGNDGSDTLFGFGGDDTLVSGDGGGAMAGGNGNDRLVAGAGAEVIVGDAGIDTVVYLASASGVVVNLGTGTGALGAAQGDTISKVENVTGSVHNDIITGDNGANNLQGDAGNDLLVGAGGVDLLNGGEGDDTLQGGADGDWLIGGVGTDTARFGSAVTVNLTTGLHSGEAAGDAFSSIERFEGSQFADILVGNGAGQALVGRGGDDTLFGEGGNDTLIGGAGTDSLEGGGGTDLVDYAAEGAAVQVNLLAGLAIGVSIDADIIDDVENVDGSAHDDSIWGDGGANLLRGLDGNDMLAGNAGADTLNGGAGDDTLVAGEGDSVIGGTGQDVLRFGSTPVLIDLLTGVHDGGADGVTISGVERIEGSTADDIMVAGAKPITFDGRGGDDTLGGGAGKDTLLGGAGDDSVNGNGGNDLIAGGQGIDTLLGGSGNDVFLWRSGDLGVDLIADFVLGQDRVAFEDFVVSPVLGGTGAASEFLRATTFLGGVTALEAHTAEAGWQVIARLSGVSVRSLDAAIDDGSILAATPPGGFDLLG